MRIRKSEFKAFLSHRYTQYISEKLLQFFDFKKAWSYSDFINAMEVLIYQSDEVLYKMVFEALDSNNDGAISEIDLYIIMKDLPNEIFISVLMDDFLKIIRYLVDKKKMKGTFDENKYNYEKIIQKMQMMNVTFRSSLSGWNKYMQEEPKPNFLHFCTNKLSPVEKKPAEKSDFSLYRRSINNSARAKIETSPESTNLNKSLIHSQRKKVLNKEDLLFGYCEERELNEKIPLSEFSAISFDHFVPNLAIDLIKSLCGHSKVKLASSNSREYLKIHRHEVEIEKIMKIIDSQEPPKK